MARVKAQFFLPLCDNDDRDLGPEKEAAQFDAEIEASSQRLSGRLTVQVPKSLHAALKLEAAREGVSLSEMIRLKLGFPYRTIASVMAGFLGGGR